MSKRNLDRFDTNLADTRIVGNTALKAASNSPFKKYGT